MLNTSNTEALEEAGYKYIVGARIKNMSKDITKQILNKESYETLAIRDEDYSYKIIDLAKNQNLLVSYSAKRARKDAHDRSEALKKLMQKMKKSKKVQSVINASGYKKYLNINGNSSLEVSEEKIAQASNWDGLHGVITNIKNINPCEVLSQYKGLWQVEETFRISKHDLKIRPIYHWSPKRIKAHIAICFMALTCIRHLEYRVNLQQVKMSPNRIRKALTSTGVTILVHINDKRLFAVPFKINDDAKIIYKTMGLKLSARPYQL
jgi:transposase